MLSAECLTGRWSAVLGVMWRAVRQQRVDAVGLRVDGVHGQLLPEGFLFSPIGEPVVDANLCDQIGAEALSLGGWHASLETFGSVGNKRGGTLAAAWLSGEEGVPSPAPVALLHQRFPLLLAGVLLPFICLVQDLLGSRSPFETVAPYFLAGGFAADVLAWLSGGVVLWEKVHRILIGFVHHSAAGPVRCLIKLCETRQATFSITNWRIKGQKFYQCLIALASFTHHRLKPSMWETQILTYVAEFPVVSAHTRCRGPLASAFSWVCLCWGAGKGGTGSGPWCPPPPAGGCCAAACNLWSCGQHAMDPRWVQVKHRRVFSRYHSKPNLLDLVTEWMVVFTW